MYSVPARPLSSSSYPSATRDNALLRISSRPGFFRCIFRPTSYSSPLFRQLGEANILGPYGLLFFLIVVLLFATSPTPPTLSSFPFPSFSKSRTDRQTRVMITGWTLLIPCASYTLFVFRPVAFYCPWRPFISLLNFFRPRKAPRPQPSRSGNQGASISPESDLNATPLSRSRRSFKVFQIGDPSPFPPCTAVALCSTCLPFSRGRPFFLSIFAINRCFC